LSSFFAQNIKSGSGAQEKIYGIKTHLPSRGKAPGASLPEYSGYYSSRRRFATFAA